MDSNSVDEAHHHSAAYIDHPTELYFDAAGSLYICDQGRNTIVAYNIVKVSGLKVNAAGTSATGTYAVVGVVRTAPVGLAVDAAGFIYIATTDAALGPVVYILSPGKNTGAFVLPLNGIAGFQFGVNATDTLGVDSFGNLYVADATNGRILRFPKGQNGYPANPQVLNLSGVSAATLVQDNLGITATPNGNLYLADEACNQIWFVSRRVTK